MGHPLLLAHATSRDKEILEHLAQMTIDQDGATSGFRITMSFHGANPFFANAQLTRTVMYALPALPLTRHRGLVVWWVCRSCLPPHMRRYGEQSIRPSVIQWKEGEGPEGGGTEREDVARASFFQLFDDAAADGASDLDDSVIWALCSAIRDVRLDRSPAP